MPLRVRRVGRSLYRTLRYDEVVVERRFPPERADTHFKAFRFEGSAEKFCRRVVDGCRLHPEGDLREEIGGDSGVETQVFLVQTAADDEFSARGDTFCDAFEEFLFLRVVKELEDIENGDIAVVLGEVGAGVALAEGDVFVIPFLNHALPAFDLSRIVIKAGNRILPTALAEIHAEDAQPAADIEEGEGAGFYFFVNSVVEGICAELRGCVVG